MTTQPAAGAVVVGPDEHGLTTALESRGLDVRTVETGAKGSAIADAGVGESTLFVVTDTADATAVAIAREANPAVRIVAYVSDTLPEFARPATDLVVDPELLDVETVATELVSFDAEATAD